MIEWRAVVGPGIWRWRSRGVDDLEAAVVVMAGSRREEVQRRRYTGTVLALKPSAVRFAKPGRMSRR